MLSLVRALTLQLVAHKLMYEESKLEFAVLPDFVSDLGEEFDEETDGMEEHKHGGKSKEMLTDSDKNRRGLRSVRELILCSLRSDPCTL